MTVQERSQKAMEYFKDGYNCCQSVVMAFDDVVGVEKDLLATVSAGFGGGFGRQREVCGCVSGMTLLSGFLSPAADPSVKVNRTDNYALVQNFCGQFKAECGSIVCKELLGLDKPSADVVSTTPMSSAEPSDRTEEYYKKRPCVELVGLAARIVAEHIEGLSAR